MCRLRSLLINCDRSDVTDAKCVDWSFTFISPHFNTRAWVNSRGGICICRRDDWFSMLECTEQSVMRDFDVDNLLTKLSN